MRRIGRRGLTLIEILIVAIIIGILTMVAVVGWQNSLRETRQREGAMYIKATADQITSYLQQRSTWGTWAEFTQYANLQRAHLQFYIEPVSGDSSITVTGGVLQNGSWIQVRPKNANLCRTIRATWNSTTRRWNVAPV